MVDKLYSAIVAMVLVAMGGALALAVLRFLLSIGPIWSMVAVAAGVAMVYWTSRRS